MELTGKPRMIKPGTVSKKLNRNRTNPSLAIRMLKNYQLYLFLLPALVYFLIFRYTPMYGIQIAFKDYLPFKGMMQSPWVGFEHFKRFFVSAEFWRLIKNTLGLSVYQLAAGFPIPIALALMLNQMNSVKYRRFVQTVIYAPHFISTVVLAGMLFVFLSPRTGVINKLIVLFGGEAIHFMASPAWFKSLYVLSGIWQNAGWSTIIFLAALTSISPELHESALVDGANKWQRIAFIDIPGILPTVVIMLIMNIGHIMSVGFEKAFLMQTSLNISSSEIISTYIYKVGLLGAQFSFSTAVGLFESVINLILILTVNIISKKLSETSLF